MILVIAGTDRVGSNTGKIARYVEVPTAIARFAETEAVKPPPVHAGWENFVSQRSVRAIANCSERYARRRSLRSCRSTAERSGESPLRCVELEQVPVRSAALARLEAAMPKP